MTKRKTSVARRAGLITLGIASRDTKGIGRDAPDFLVGQEQNPSTGLSAD